MWFPHVLWVHTALLIAQVVTALPSHRLNSRAPVEPSQDPFYQPPAGYESQAPGTILRQRQIVAAIFGFLPELVEAHQLLYRTTAVNGTPIATVTTIFKPLLALPDRFVSFHTAYDSAASKCDPSYGYQLGASENELVGSAENLIIQAYLLSGYTVSSPDYEGPDAAFSPGHLEGMAVLDSMRAVTNFKTLKFSTSTPAIVGVGYSGGAIATGWAASLHPIYAPELPLKGWVAGGTPSNLTSTLLHIDNTTFAGFTLSAFSGLSKPSAYGAQLQPLLDRILTPYGRAEIDYASTHCSADVLSNFSGNSLLSYDLQTEGPQVLYEPTLRAVLDLNVMGANKTETPIAPVFLYHASQDEIVPYDSASQLADTWCNDGVSVKFTTFGIGGHISTEVIGVPNALTFVAEAFNGLTAKGCSRDTEFGGLNSTSTNSNLTQLMSKLSEVQQIAGDNDSNVKANPGVLKQGIST